MPQGTTTSAPPSLSVRFTAFVTERHPFAAAAAADAWAAAVAGEVASEASIDALRGRLLPELRRRAAKLAPRETGETTPGVTVAQRFEGAVDELVEDCDGFLRRARCAHR